jgi:hypothetical protein
MSETKIRDSKISKTLEQRKRNPSRREFQTTGSCGHPALGAGQGFEAKSSFCGLHQDWPLASGPFEEEEVRKREHLRKKSPLVRENKNRTRVANRQ